MENLLIDVDITALTRALKRVAREKARHAVRSGRLTRVKCTWFDCYEAQTEAHHPDYRYALNVIWLCNEHHRKHHVSLRRLSRFEAYREMFGLDVG